jgi:hypothetical protein
MEDQPWAGSGLGSFIEGKTRGKLAGEGEGGGEMVFLKDLCERSEIVIYAGR